MSGGIFIFIFRKKSNACLNILPPVRYTDISGILWNAGDKKRVDKEKEHMNILQDVLAAPFLFS